MCLSVPAEVISLNGDTAKARIGGITYTASLQLVDDINVGDYVIIHSGYAIEKLDKENALETLSYFDEINELNRNENKE